MPQTQRSGPPHQTGRPPNTTTQQRSAVEFTGPVAGWCPPGGCPRWTHEKVTHAVGLAWAKAWNDAQEFMTETAATWRPLARKSYEAKVAERMAEMDRVARRRAADLGIPYVIYPGGPVDWETGLPLQIVEAAA